MEKMAKQAREYLDTGPNSTRRHALGSAGGGRVERADRLEVVGKVERSGQEEDGYGGRRRQRGPAEGALKKLEKPKPKREGIKL